MKPKSSLIWIAIHFRPHCNQNMKQLTRENPKPELQSWSRRLTKSCFELLSELFTSKHFV